MGKSPQPEAIPGRQRLVQAMPLLLVLSAVIIAYLPVLRCGFVDFDDNVYVTENLHVQAGLSWEAVQWAFANFSAGFWHPLTWLSHMLDCQLYGLNAWGHHLTNLALHLANTALLLLLLRQLTGKHWQSAVAAGLFGLHPLHVESVAWVAERKDVLSTFFFLPTLLAYCKYVENVQAPVASVERASRSVSHLPTYPLTHLLRRSSSGSWYIASLLLYALGLMSKAMLVTLPLVLLLLDFWPLRRFKRVEGDEREVKNSSVAFRLLFEKVPFLALALVFAVLTYLAERRFGALALEAGPPFHARLMNAVISYVGYLGKAIWPAHLAVFYPYPSSFTSWQLAGAVLILLAVTVSVLLLRRSVPCLLMGWSWYGVTLLPVIGVIQVGSHAMADRYTYLPLIGIFIAVVFALPNVSALRGLQSGWRAMGMCAAMALLAACGVLTFQQLKHWRDSEALFQHDLDVVGNNVPALTGLGVVLLESGKPEAAAQRFADALRLDAGHVPARNNLGMALELEGKPAEAAGQFRQILRAHPDNAEAHNNLGKCLAEQGELTNAVVEFSEAIRLQPDYAQARFNLEKARHQLGL